MANKFSNNVFIIGILLLSSCKKNDNDFRQELSRPLYTTNQVPEKAVDSFNTKPENKNENEWGIKKSNT